MKNDSVEMILIRTSGSDFDVMYYKEDVKKAKMYTFSDLTEVFENEEEVKKYYEERYETINEDNEIESYEEFINEIIYHDIIVYYEFNRPYILNFDFHWCVEMKYEEISVREVCYKKYKGIYIYVLKDDNTGAYYYGYGYMDYLYKYEIFFEKDYFEEEYIEKIQEIIDAEFSRYEL